LENNANGLALAPKPRKTRKGLWRLAALMLLCLVGSAAVSFFVFVNAGARIPRELAGTWQVTEGPLQGATLEFHGDGTTLATRYEHGSKSVTRQSARVEGKKLYLTTVDDSSGKEDTVVQTIVRLNESELIITDMDRNIYRMKRVGN
jgi:uncharacterized protein (TIGR03066 family)